MIQAGTRRSNERAVATAAVLAVCLPVGLVAGRAPLLALVAVAAVLGVAYAASSLPAAVAVFTLISVTPLGAHEKVVIAALVGVGLVWLATRAFASRSQATPSFVRTHPGLTLLLLALVAWVAISQLWAPDVGAVRSSLLRYVLVVLLFPLVFAAAQSRRGAVVIGGGFAVGALASVVMAILGVQLPQDPASVGTDYGTRLVGGPATDPNIFASLLLTGAAFAIVLGTRGVGLATGWRWAFRAIPPIMVVAVVATGSRGAVVAILAMLMTLPLVSGRRRGRSLLLVATSLAIVGALATSSASPLAERFQEEGLNSSGRTELWKVGWEMAKDRPLLGVGANNFRQTSRNYLLDVGLLNSGEYIVDRPLVVHNSYLQMLAETGIPGLLLLLGIIGVCGSCAVRALRLFAARGDPVMHRLAQALVVSLAGFLAALIFVSYVDYGRPFFMLLALGPGLLALARRTS